MSDAEIGFLIGRWGAPLIIFFLYTRVFLWALKKVNPWTRRLAISHTVAVLILLATWWTNWDQGSDTGSRLLDVILFIVEIAIVTLFDVRRLRQAALKAVAAT